MKELGKSKYNRAKKKVESIKGFYSHLTVYLVINAAILIVKFVVFKGEEFDRHIPLWSWLSTPVFWGIGLFFHGLWVFSDKLGFIRNWEERKIREFMREDEKEQNQKWQ